MKKIWISVIMATTLLCTSCSDFLEVDSPSKFGTAYVFGNETEMETAVNGIYVPMVGSGGWVGNMSQHFLMNTDVEFREVRSNTIGEYCFLPAPNQMNGYNAAWKAMYDGINRANDVLEGIEQSELFKTADRTRPSKVLHFYSEAMVLRAMYYLELVSNWGDVPYRRKSAGDKNELLIGATDRDIILSDMIDDLIAVEPWLYYAGESDKGAEGVSREFCQALIARIALRRGGYSLRPDYNNPFAIGSMKRSEDWKEYYEIAEEYAGKVITEGKHDLKRSFREVWEDECNWIVPADDDIIFDVPAKVGGTGEYGYFHGTLISSSKDANDANYSNAPQGYSQASLKLCPTYVFTFDRKDLRRDITCELFKYENSGRTNIKQTFENFGFNSFKCGKWNRLFMKSPLGNTSNKGTGINYPYMRYADVLLMYAEAANENNGAPTPEAKAALKKVRTRAFGVEDHTDKVEAYVENLASKDDFFKAIVDERAWEFGGEKQRRFDLARWNLYGEVVYNLYHNWITMGRVAYTKTNANFEDPVTEATPFDDYPAKLYYKYVPANGTGVTSLVDQVIEYYKEGDINSYDQALPSYDTKPTGYEEGKVCTIFLKEIKDEVTEEHIDWVPADGVHYAFYGYINRDNASSVDPDVDPVRYFAPIPTDALSSHQGMLQNYYGF
ncbi:MAG: RagB/SusD family nutrient uptake outer membrane protein [Bacteroides ovatus]|uniref:RagB/SusD family nutrient uptake outer membrane protein n=1 Tax=Bacteroides sp. TaxID=29523 RepID=UPI003A1B28DD|nr:RagB/SusD family nutrient uptake outer membrane protein [Bacteroides ovatus]